MQKRLICALTLLMTLSASGCAKSGQSDSFCRVSNPIWFSDADIMTESTEMLIIRHNERGERLCGWFADGGKPE